MAKVKILRELNGVFPRYQPVVGRIYEADYVPFNRRRCGSGWTGHGEFCLIHILDKKIVIRPGEYELLEV